MRELASNAGAALCAALAACASMQRDDTLPTPQVSARAESYAGSPLTGPLPEGAAPSIDSDPAHALRATCEVVFLERVERAPGASLASVARIVLATREEDPFPATLELGSGLRVLGPAEVDDLRARAEAGELGRRASAGTLESVLLGGATSRFEVSGTEAGADSLRAVAVELRPTLHGKWIEVGVRVEGTSGTPPGPRVETALLASLGEGDARKLALVVPAPFGALEPLALALIVEVNGAAGEGDVSRALDDIARRGRERREAASDLSTAERSWREVLSAFGALGVERYHRSAVVFLADAVHAPLSGDIALVASEADLAAFVAAVGEKAKVEPDAEPSQADLAWLLESVAYSTLAQRAGEGKLALELDALLLRHAGEAGRYAGTIQNALAEARSVADIDARWVLENRIALEDASPSARVRAFDWLAARGLAPAGFDPLGTLAERRAAIAAAE